MAAANGSPREGGEGSAPVDLDLVVVDVETTGWLPDQAELIEIGAVRLSGGRPVGEFYSLLRPTGPIPPDITALTGISDAMVRRAPPAAVALRTFLAFASGCALVAHNAPFDLGFLTSGCRSSGIEWPPAAVLDTAVLARLVLGRDQVPDCKLATLARFFATSVAPCHRALPDAQATADVLLGLLKMLAAPPRAGPASPRRAAQQRPRPRPRWRSAPDRRPVGRPLYATAATGAWVPGERRRRPWSPLSS